MCIHGLFSLGPFMVALRDGLNTQSLGFAIEDNKKAYFQCLDPDQPYTEGGTVICEVTQVSSKN